MVATSRALLVHYAPEFVKRIVRKTRHGLAQLQLRRRPPRLLFVFGGRTQFWPGAGRELYAREPVFRATVQECERITAQVLGGPSILSQFEGEPDPDFFSDEQRLMHTSVVMQLALVQLWRAQIVQPEAILGISLGEIAAVYAAEGLSLTDALRISACYYGVSKVESPAYSVLLVEASLASTAFLLSSCPVELAIVLVLNATSCLAFCAAADIAAAVAYLAEQGIGSKSLHTETVLPYHMTRLAHHLDTLRQPLRGLQPLPLALPCYLSTVGRLVPPGTVLGADYWLTLLQYPVNVHGALEEALADGYRLLVPVGGHPFPFFNSPAQQHRLAGVRFLDYMHPDNAEWQTLDYNRQEVARLRPGQPVLAAQPLMTAVDFATQLQPLAPDQIAYPHTWLAFLRQHGPVHFLPAENAWLVLEAELAQEVLRQPQLYSSKITGDFDAELVGADPPTHTENRAIFQPFFSPKELSALGSYTTDMVQELAASLASQQSFDFVLEFAVPLTQAVAGHLMGLTRSERKKLQQSLPGHPYALHYLPELVEFFATYFRQRQAPAEPPVMLDKLLAHVEAGQLAADAALNLTKTMWLAGIATSSMLMSSAVHYLLTHPTVAEQLRAQPDLVDVFIEEILRLEPPLTLLRRVTNQAVTLAGHEIPADAIVIAYVSATNRDPARYTNPDELDLNRRPLRHLSFGSGIHACMGAHLARLEARIVIKWVLAQGSALRLRNPAALPDYYPNNHFRGQASLPLVLLPSLSA